MAAPDAALAHSDDLYGISRTLSAALCTVVLRDNTWIKRKIDEIYLYIYLSLFMEDYRIYFTDFWGVFGP